jgi:hypothetical protein
MNFIESTKEKLEVNKADWVSLWSGYANKIMAKEQMMTQFLKSFHEWKPLRIYISVNDINSKALPNRFSLRFKGQQVARLIVNSKTKPTLSVDASEMRANKTYFAIDLPEGDYSWRSDEAKDFRKAFKECTTKHGNSPEAMFESNILDEMEMKSSEKFVGTFRDIQPIRLVNNRLRFQMPVPTTASTGAPFYKRGKPGKIDILARTGRGSHTNISIIELKRDDAKSYKHALAQSIIYAVNIRYLLRENNLGEKWWRLFRFNKAIPQMLKLTSVVMIPHTMSDLYFKEREQLGLSTMEAIPVGNDIIRTRLITFQQKNERIQIVSDSFGKNLKL